MSNLPDVVSREEWHAARNELLAKEKELTRLLRAAALGNVLVQARTLGADLPDVPSMRDLVRRTHEVRTHTPRPGLDWEDAEARVAGSSQGAMT